MTRVAHWLKPVQSAVYPRDLVCFDTETVERKLDDKTTEHVLEFGWAARTEFVHERKWLEPKWFRFTDSIAFWQWLEDTTRAKRCTWVYCHNANFDWQVTNMMRLLPSLGWKCDVAMIEDPPNYFRWRKGTKTLKLLDSTNYWRVALRKLGERLGIQKLELPANWDNTEVGDEYCKRDVTILLVALQQWIAWLKDNQLGGLGITLAQQAWKAYTYRFLDEAIFIDDDTDSHELSRLAYYGGRVECMTHGIVVRNVKCLDVNSMYPYVMRDREYPTRLHGLYHRVELDELDNWLSKYAVIADVEINTDVPCYPERTPDGLMFPIGSFRTYLSTPELLYARNNGHITRCHCAAVYDKAQIFRTFVTDLYKLRLGFINAGDDTASYYTKIMMNSLYGKTGQRGISEEILGECDPTELYSETEIDLETGIKYRNRHIAGLILSRTASGESRYSFPAIAAHVTAYARMLLWDYMNIAGFENLYYMDTDSLHVNFNGYDRLRSFLSETELGQLKLEKSPAMALYYGPKDYELDGVRTLKGVSQQAKQLGFGRFVQPQWVSIKGSMIADHSGGPLVRRIEKRHKREYKKGRVTDAGLVLPFIRRLLHLQTGDGTDV